MTEQLKPVVIFVQGEAHRVEMHDDFGFAGSDPTDHDIAEGFRTTTLGSIEAEETKMIEFAKFRERTQTFHDNLAQSAVRGFFAEQGPLGMSFSILNKDERKAARVTGSTVFSRTRRRK
jgi:hypothetical protein